MARRKMSGIGRIKRRSAQRGGPEPFAAEKRGINAGIGGGLAMIIIAIAWFVIGLAAGYIYFYPPVLLVVGIGAVLKGLAGGGSRPVRRRRRRTRRDEDDEGDEPTEADDDRLMREGDR